MKLTLSIILTIVLLFGMTGCKSKHEAFFDEMLTLDEQIQDVLDTVNDDVSAEQARPKLEALVQRSGETARKVQTLGEPSQKEMEQIEKKYGERAMKLAKRAMENMPKFRKYRLGGAPSQNPMLSPMK